MAVPKRPAVTVLNVTVLAGPTWRAEPTGPQEPKALRQPTTAQPGSQNPAWARQVDGGPCPDCACVAWTGGPGHAAAGYLYRGKAPRPAYTAASSSSSSMRSSWLYLLMRSPRAGAPVLIWPELVATARSAIVVSSVSPER